MLLPDQHLDHITRWDMTGTPTPPETTTAAAAAEPAAESAAK
jgi:hypothetical protein